MTGCSKDEPSLNQTTKLVQKTADEQNVDAANVVIQRYSKVVAVALENQNFRTLLKQLALKQFDGDYDVLASDYWDSKSEVYNLGNGFSFKFNN